MKQIRTILLTLLLTVLPATAVYGQTGNHAYPFDMSVQVVPPFNTNLYDLIPADRFRIAVMMRDMQHQNYEFMVEMKVYDIAGSSPKLILRSERIQVGNAGINRALTHDELRSIFTHNRANGEFTEGAYRLVFQVFDADKRIPVSREYRQIAYLEEGAPPRLLRPADGVKILSLQATPEDDVEEVTAAEITATEIHSPMGIFFSWIMPYYFPTNNIPNTYKLEIYEIGENANPNNAVQSSSLIYSQTVNATMHFVQNTAGTFANTAGQLEDGHRYAWRVCLINNELYPGTDRKVTVKNKGCSEVYAFTYGTEVHRLSLLAEYKPTPRMKFNYEDLPEIEITHLPDSFTVNDNNVCWKTVDPSRMDEYDGFRVEIRKKEGSKKEENSEDGDKPTEDHKHNGVVIGKDENGEDIVINDCNNPEGWVVINGAEWDDRTVPYTPQNTGNNEDDTAAGTGENNGTNDGNGTNGNQEDNNGDTPVVTDLTMLCRTLSNIKYRTTYEVRIQGYVTEDETDETGRTYGPCAFGEFWIADTLDNKCGEPLPPLKSATAKNDIKAGDVFSANGYSVIINEPLENNNGSYTGTGHIRFPIVPVYSLKVKFENIKINEKYELLEGMVVTETGQPDLLLDLNQLLGSGYAGADEAPTPNKMEYENNADRSIDEINIENMAEGAWFTAGDGKMYMKSGNEKESIGTVKTKEELPFDNNNDINRGARIVFTPVDGNTTLAFDNDRYGFRNAATLNSSYTVHSGYTVPWIAMNPGRVERLKATQTGGSLQNVKYVIEIDKTSGSLLELETEENGTIVKVPASARTAETTEIFAIAQINGSNKVAGKVKMANYAPKTKTLVLVPTGPLATGRSINKAAIENELKDTYGRLGITFTVEAAQPFATGENDLSFPIAGLANNTGITDKSFWGNESAQMKEIRQKYKADRGFSNDKAYLFVLNTNTPSTVQGDMPRGKAVGFVFNNNSEFNDGRLVAHELGHGMFNLEHVFDPVYGVKEQGQTNNLLDYKSGTDNKHLMYWQWQAIDSWQMVWDFAQRDEESQGILDGLLGGMSDDDKINYLLNQLHCAMKSSPSLMYVPYKEEQISGTYTLVPYSNGNEIDFNVTFTFSDKDKEYQDVTVNKVEQVRLIISQSEKWYSISDNVILTIESENGQSQELELLLNKINNGLNSTGSEENIQIQLLRGYISNNKRQEAVKLLDNFSSCMYDELTCNDVIYLLNCLADNSLPEKEELKTINLLRKATNFESVDDRMRVARAIGETKNIRNDKTLFELFDDGIDDNGGMNYHSEFLKLLMELCLSVYNDSYYNELKKYDFGCNFGTYDDNTSFSDLFTKNSYSIDDVGKFNIVSSYENGRLGKQQGEYHWQRNGIPSHSLYPTDPINMSYECFDDNSYSSRLVPAYVMMYKIKAHRKGEHTRIASEMLNVATFTASVFSLGIGTTATSSVKFVQFLIKSANVLSWFGTVSSGFNLFLSDTYIQNSIQENDLLKFGFGWFEVINRGLSGENAIQGLILDFAKLRSAIPACITFLSELNELTDNEKDKQRLEMLEKFKELNKILNENTIY